MSERELEGYSGNHDYDAEDIAFRKVFMRSLPETPNDKPLSKFEWKELHEYRKVLRGEVKEIRTMFDKVKTEKRSLSKDEELASNAIMRRLAFVKNEFDRRDEVKIAEEGLKNMNNLGLVSNKDGTVRAYRKEERISNPLQQNTLPDGIRAEDLNLGRWFRGIVTGDWSGAEAERRAMGGNSDVLGGYLVPEPLSLNVINLARNQARVIQAGALTIPMTSSSLKIAKVLTDIQSYWVPENTAGTFSDLGFGMVTLNSHKLMALAKISLEVVEDAANIDMLVQQAIASALALELDRCCLMGDGVGKPMGIRNYEGVQTITLGTGNGGKLDGYNTFSRAVQKVAEVNGPSEGLSVIYAPRTAGDLDRMLDGNGEPLKPYPSWDKLNKFVTNQVPVNLTAGNVSNASEAYVGDFSRLLIGMRTGLNLEISRVAADSTGSAFTEAQIWIRAYLRADTALTHSNFFTVIESILPEE